MADAAACHLSQAKRFRRSLATGPDKVVGLTDRWVATETTTARLRAEIRASSERLEGCSSPPRR